MITIVVQLFDERMVLHDESGCDCGCAHERCARGQGVYLYGFGVCVGGSGCARGGGGTVTQVVVVVPSDDVAFVRACALYLCAGVGYVTSVTSARSYRFREGVTLDDYQSAEQGPARCGPHVCG